MSVTIGSNLLWWTGGTTATKSFRERIIGGSQNFLQPAEEIETGSLYLHVGAYTIFAFLQVKAPFDWGGSR